MSKAILDCSYTNTSKGNQVVRLTGLGRGLEKIVSPGMSVFFQSGSDNVLEIYDFQYVTSILSGRIECEQLALH